MAGCAVVGEDGCAKFHGLRVVCQHVNGLTFVGFKGFFQLGIGNLCLAVVFGNRAPFAEAFIGTKATKPK